MLQVVTWLLDTEQRVRVLLLSKLKEQNHFSEAGQLRITLGQTAALLPNN